MPEKFLHLEFDEELATDSPGGVRTPQSGTPRSSALLDLGGSPSHHHHHDDNTTTNPTTEQLLTLVEHARSKSEGFKTDRVPELTKLHRGNTPPPTDHSAANNKDDDLRESNSSNNFYPVPTVKAPSPMKVWADQWSPSLLSAQALRQGMSNPFAPETIRTIEQQNQMLDQQQQLAAFQQQQQQFQQHQAAYFFQQQQQQQHQAFLGMVPPNQLFVSAQTGGGHPQQQQHHAGAVGQQSHHQASAAAVNNQILQFQQQGVFPVQQFGATQQYHRAPDRASFGRNHTPPPMPRSAASGAASNSGGKSSEGKNSNSKPNNNKNGSTSSSPPQPQQPPSANKQQAEKEQTQTKSDSAPFIFNGWKYPGGLNRKERRRIMFSGEITGEDYPGAVFIGADVPNGPCDENGVPTGAKDE